MMYTKEQAYAEIAKLVNTFKSSETRLNNEAEAQIENNFIRPLFKYLNWNTENDGLAIPDYEFVVQRTNRYGKRPDYILQLDGQHLLVMDAKQVKLDMHDPRWMNQVYAYAYSTQTLSPSRKIDFAILTDFQEFVVLDCTLYARKPKAVTKFCVLDWRYDHYVTKFDELWELFERENMRQAARTRGTHALAGLWAQALSPKKVDANRIPPDEAFLTEMDDDKTGWRIRLAKDMKKHNPEADGALITAAVQLLIDRLIFVKALSDREIEDDYLSQLAETVERDGLAESNIGWFAACRTIFAKLNEFYNGSIFESRPELEAVTVSNKVVRDIIQSLQPENSSYNFAVLPVEILGTIYERFLGRVVRTTDKQVKIEDKPEVRKAGGVYYTPQYIVNYIVQNTVGKLLGECRTPEDVAQLKILDPACGSGSFLLGAYNALIEWHIRYYSDKARLTKQDRTVVYRDSDGSVRLTAKLKRQILLNNLYGVDIDRQAMEVTRFSLSLKALEDIRQDEVYEERKLEKRTLLPDLSQNIKCGNSLIGSDYFAGQMFSDPAKLKRVNPFDWEHQFLHGGFDAVIGNPPWGGDIDEDLSYFHSQYPNTTQEHTDSFKLFIEKGLRLARQNGLVSMIVPNTLLRQRRLKDVRSFLLNSTILTLADLGEDVFKGVVAPSCIFVVANRRPDDSHKTTTANLGKLSNEQKADALHVGAQANAVQQILFRENPDLEFAATQRKPLASVVVLGEFDELALKDAGINYQRVKVGMQEKGKSDLAERLLYEGNQQKKRDKMYWKGTDIDRYCIAETTERFCRTNYQDFIRANEVVHLNEKAYDTVPKIVFRQTADRIIATIDYKGIWFGRSIIALVLKQPSSYKIEYFLGILNSKYFQRLYDEIAQETGRVFAQVKLSKVKQLPIRTINFVDPADKARHDKMVQLVESMLALHKHKAAAKTQADQELYQRQIEATDREIDALVYELYGLTPDEIAVVEAVR